MNNEPNNARGPSPTMEDIARLYLQHQVLTEQLEHLMQRYNVLEPMVWMDEGIQPVSGGGIEWPWWGLSGVGGTTLTVGSGYYQWGLDVNATTEKVVARRYAGGTVTGMSTNGTYIATFYIDASSSVSSPTVGVEAVAYGTPSTNTWYAGEAKKTSWPLGKVTVAGGVISAIEPWYPPACLREAVF